MTVTGFRFGCVVAILVSFVLPTVSMSGNGATPADQLTVPDGFQAELLYSVPEGQGSWVSMAVDDRGRLITSDQYDAGMFRITLKDDGEVDVESLDVEIGMAQGLLYAFDSLYVNVNGQGPSGGGLYRLQDTNGDDQFDQIEHLMKLNPAGEHGPHAVLLSPDGESIYICAGNNTDLPDPMPPRTRVPLIWDEDHLLGRMPDARGHNVGRLAPGGWIIKLNPDGSGQELICTGFRNQYDMAFNPQGELFTYDSDMEWDIGTPWYRPTRVNHVTSGAEFGWRNGTGKWPEYYPDNLPATIDIGPGSPTGMTFATGARFPARYQQALLLGDWSYGIIYAAFLEPEGSSYTGTFENFVSGVPLPITAMLIHPEDGALYFTTGGRRTQSGLYRIRYVGEESTEPVEHPQHDAGSELRLLRQRLEKYHGVKSDEAVEEAWPHLGHEDRFIRFAARTAVEHQPRHQWHERVLAEQQPAALINGAVALARVAGKELETDSEKEQVQREVIQALGRVPWGQLPQQGKLELLRAYALSFTRLGSPDDTVRQQVIDRMNDHLPDPSDLVNRELAQLLIYVRAPEIVARTVELLENSPTQEDQIHYAFSLRDVRQGWTPQLRERYFQWFNRAAGHRGGMSFGGFLENIRNEAIASLSDEEKSALEPILAVRPEPVDPVELTDREFVKQWSVEELLPLVDDRLAGRDFEQGRQYFAEAMCFHCHRFAGQGGIAGPDLTAVAGRFSNRDLLESIIDPSREISDQYQATQFVIDDGRVITGRIVNLHGDNYTILTDMLDPSSLTDVRRDQIEMMRPSPLSMMPTGLLDSFTEEEILDLIAYLRSGGDPNHEVFQAGE